MKESDMSALAQAGITFVVKGAQQYLQAHNLYPVSNDALAECCKAWAKIKLPEALNDAKEAFACNMNQVGVATFAATMMQGGIEAAKEAADYAQAVKQGTPLPATH